MKGEEKGWENRKNKVTVYDACWTCEFEQSGVFIAQWCNVIIVGVGGVACGEGWSNDDGGQTITVWPG